MTNPLLAPWRTPFEMPPFDDIEPRHFPDAYEAAFAEQRSAIGRICANPQPADFANTVAALEHSDELLRRVRGVFENLAISHSNEAIAALERQLNPAVAVHEGSIWTDSALHARVAAVAGGNEELHAEQQYLLEYLLQRFERAGAALPPREKAELLALDEELAALYTRFEQNVRDDSNAYLLVLEHSGDIAGLPDFVLEVARAEAERQGQPGRFAFTLSRSSITPFLTYADNRALRQQIYTAYVNCGDNDNAFNNRDTIARIVALRQRRAQLLGQPSHAHFMLDDRMAKTPAAVRELLDRVWNPARDQVRSEAAELRAIAGGEIDRLEAWDWWYYTEKLRRQRFDLEPDEVKSYFPLARVRDGAFAVASRLFDISFTPIDGLPCYHEEVEAFEVRDADGGHLGIFLTDYLQRPSKASGAWMSEFRGASALGEKVRPIVVNCCNFNHSEAGLLDVDEVRTLFHELGHALHGLLTQTPYPSFSGTSVKQDFVELPSQIMEHWAREPEVLRKYACHYETGAPIPDALIERLRAAESFNQGFATAEYLAACYLDLAWHELEAVPAMAVPDFERQALADIGFPEPLDPRYRSCYFKHVFTGDAYSAGYYAYIWAEVLDADAFEAFRENGLFDRPTAMAFRRNVLERGGSADPMSLYVAFRGREPDTQPLLRNRGLAPERDAA